MNALARFIMKGRSQAILAITALTVLSWLLSLASLLAAAALALPTLRRGAREGAMLLAAALPIVALAGQLIMGSALQAAGYSLAMWVPVFLVALVLRQTANLSMAVTSAMALGVLVVLGFYALVADPVGFWNGLLQQVLAPLLQKGASDPGQALLIQTAQAFSRYATGAVTAGSVISVLISLFLARWWQASLYNPGGFRQEFLQLRMPAYLAWIFVALVVTASVAEAGIATFAINLLMPLLMAFLLGGFAVAHAVLTQTPSGRFWLAGLYVALMFLTPIILLVALVGLTDTWFDWRLRFARPST